MKYKFSKIVSGMVLACSLMTAEPNIIHADTMSYFTVLPDSLPIYDNRTGSLVEVGELTKGQAFKAKSDGGNWLQIDYGGYKGYVYKGQTTPTVSVPYKNANTKYKNTATMINAVKNAPVYDNSTGELMQFATIKMGQSYPILYKMGNWYAVDVDGRIGYVHYSTVMEGKKENPPVPDPAPVPPENPNQKFIKATVDTPLFDNRRGSLDEIGKLLKGQEIAVVNDQYSEDLIQVKWSNTYAYVKKIDVQETSDKDFMNDDTADSINQSIIPLQNNEPIYDHTGGKFTPFAVLNNNHRYPIIGKVSSWYMVDFGGRLGYIHESNVKADKGIAVLMYHHILDAKDLGNWEGVSTTITTEQFKSEMDYLYQQGYEPILTTDLEKFVQGNITLPVKSVVITFDDGLLSVKQNAYPILQQYGMKATDFDITNRNGDEPIGQSFDPLKLQSLSTQDIKAMSDVFDFQSHTNGMHNLIDGKSDVITQPYDVVKNDILISKNILNAHSFAYPFGQYNASTMQMLKELGFVSAFTTRKGYVNPSDDLLQLNRFGIYQSTSLQEFENLVSH
ncbi:polysaccharide deacetylase family protein [Bacillus sp. BRMEA1]|uniref:polysaccharide deacetylase family protein n=1 Tax=Neobacillus endophyticus TaxID=2738405 RepID=UPI0015678B64|nr:polysaccharide deacetylase family protein [Neobacillus endophyticus]NRD77263.1 polysaccharide deacetylase family protein [Neobacillus endophyticus]